MENRGVQRTSGDPSHRRIRLGFCADRVHEKKIGVAVVTNARGPVQPFTEILAQDVINRLVGIDGTDQLPSLVSKSLIAQTIMPLATATREASGPLQVSAKNLSLPPETYVG